MLDALLPIIVIGSLLAIAVLAYANRIRERRWRFQHLHQRTELGENEMVDAYCTDGITRDIALRTIRFVANILHIAPGLLRPEDTIISLKAPYRSMYDDLGVLDDALTEAKLADKSLASQTRTIADIVRLVASAEAKKGRDVV